MKDLCPVICVAVLMAAPAFAAADKPADLDAAYKAAGMVKKAGQWVGCADDQYARAEVADDGYRDLNGDGIKDLVISDFGSFCYGSAEQGFFVLTKATAAGPWKVLYQSQGIPTFLPTKVKTPGGWPDVEIGGPGFCFPIHRWNGKDYVFNRNKEYEKGACTGR